MDIRKVAFTGSTEVGRLILQASAKSNLKKVQLELGGKSPLVVFSDADVSFAVKTAMMSIFTNNGQLCTAASRCYVHADVYDKFVAEAVEKAKVMKVGDQMDPTSETGPLVDKAQFEKVLDLLQKGKEGGATVNCGGGRHGDKGYFIQPTVFTNVSDDNIIAKEEIFGPVQCIIKFNTLEEVIEKANNTNYGLAAGVITSNIGNMYALSNRLKAGTVWVNTYHAVMVNAEFGGYKESGFGKEGGVEGVNEWTLTKTVVVSTPKL